MPDFSRFSRFLPAIIFGFWPLCAQASSLTLTNTLDYSTGTYGTNRPTDILYEAIAAGYKSDPYKLSLTVPYLRVKGPADVIPDVGSLGGSAPIVTRSGLGDLIFSAAYNLSLDDLPDTDFDFVGKAKIGTASYAKGLGTGENDYSLESTVTQQISEQISIFGTLGYRFEGDPVETRLNNVWYSSAGVTWQENKETSIGAWLDYRGAASIFGKEQLELTAFAAYRFDADWKLTAYSVAGFEEGSPAVEAGLMISRDISL